LICYSDELLTAKVKLSYTDFPTNYKYIIVLQHSRLLISKLKGIDTNV